MDNFAQKLFFLLLILQVMPHSLYTLIQILLERCRYNRINYLALNSSNITVHVFHGTFKIVHEFDIGSQDAKFEIIVCHVVALINSLVA